MSIWNDIRKRGLGQEKKEEDLHQDKPVSHAEGTGTYVSGMNSHAEGYGSYASGTCSHAEWSWNNCHW